MHSMYINTRTLDVQQKKKQQKSFDVMPTCYFDMLREMI